MTQWNTDLFLKILSIVLSVFTPFALILAFGEYKTVSQYWTTPGQPLFIIMNAMTSYFLFSTRRWTIPAAFLLLLTAFSVDLAPLAHNIFAGGFFVSTTYPILKSKRLWWYIIPYVLAGAFTLINSLYGEISAILVICAYHAHTMYYFYKLKSRNN